MAHDKTTPPFLGIRALRDEKAALREPVPRAETATMQLKKLQDSEAMREICRRIADRIRTVVDEIVVNEKSEGKSAANAFKIYTQVIPVLESEKLIDHGMPIVAIALALEMLGAPCEELSQIGLEDPRTRLNERKNPTYVAMGLSQYYLKEREVSLTTETPCIGGVSREPTQDFAPTVPDGGLGIRAIIREIQTLDQVLLVLDDPHDYEVAQVKNVLRKTILKAADRDPEKMRVLVDAIENMEGDSLSSGGQWRFLWQVHRAIMSGKDLREDF